MTATAGARVDGAPSRRWVVDAARRRGRPHRRRGALGGEVLLHGGAPSVAGRPSLGSVTAAVLSCADDAAVACCATGGRAAAALWVAAAFPSAGRPRARQGSDADECHDGESPTLIARLLLCSLLGRRLEKHRHGSTVQAGERCGGTETCG